MAIELARRGRATSVCALAPGGFWAAGDGLQTQISKGLKRNMKIGHVMRPVIPLMCRPASLHRLYLREVSDIVDGTFQVAPVDPLPCPITIAWSGNDALLPVARYEKNVRERLPQATFKVLPDVGHVPVFDDPDLVARTTLAATAAPK